MTLNDVEVERHNGVISRYLTEFGSLGATDVTVVEDGPLSMGQKCSPKVTSFWQYMAYGNIY